MKKLVFASVVALSTVGFVAGPMLRAQDQGGQITIKDPAEYNAYQMFSTQTDPKHKAAAGGSFLGKVSPERGEESLFSTPFSTPIRPRAINKRSSTPRASCCRLTPTT